MSSPHHSHRNIEESPAPGIPAFSLDIPPSPDDVIGTVFAEGGEGFSRIQAAQINNLYPGARITDDQFNMYTGSLASGTALDIIVPREVGQRDQQTGGVRKSRRLLLIGVAVSR